MSSRKETVKVCDQCAKRVSDEGEMYFGGHPHQGWFEVHEHGGSTTLAALRQKRDWDFCGIKCLMDFATEKR